MGTGSGWWRGMIAALLLALSLPACGGEGDGGSSSGGDGDGGPDSAEAVEADPGSGCASPVALDKPCAGALRVCTDALHYRQRQQLSCDAPDDAKALREAGLDPACCTGTTCADMGTRACRQGELCVHEQPPAAARPDESYSPCRAPSARFRSTFCCHADDDCRQGLGGTAFRCAEPPSGKSTNRICLPLPPAGTCWDDADCTHGQRCAGGSGGCACNANCFLTLGSCS